MQINRDVSQQKISLFSGTFRPIPKNASVPISSFSLGDWGQVEEDSGIIEILPGLLSHLEKDPSIVMVLFLGDLAYDFIGEKYFSMLEYIEPITSRICFMATPGNHDYVYHEDSF